MNHIAFDKTEKGREEIATRKYHLAPRLRALLLLFDGKRTTAEVLQKIDGIGVSEQNIQELFRDGYIQAHAQQPLPAHASGPLNEPQPALAASEPAQQTTAVPAVEAIPDGQTLLEALYNFYSETIRSAIGLRGYALQLKVERARSVEDFRLMRNDYLAAVTKAQGEAAAHELNQRLEQLLRMEPASQLTG